MQENAFVVKNGKRLRCGYTTGSCATAAASAAAELLLGQLPVNSVSILLPGGEQAVFTVGDIAIAENAASCSVVKDAGDDPDVTDGIKIFAECFLGGEELMLSGGPGVGVATCRGLRCPEGEAAINPVPRRMIVENVAAVCQRHGYSQGMRIVISVPEGEAVAQKTFNPRIGIKGGISILGTTGIVEPMSEKALVDTIKVLVDKQQAANRENILVAPGNYGRDYCREQLGLDIAKAVKCSNFIGETVDYLVYKGFKRLLLVGHVGKLIKIAGGIMNTHSAVADCRMEILAAHAACLGGGQELAQGLLACLTTDQAIELLQEAGLCEAVFEQAMGKMLFHLRQRAKGALEIGAVMFGAERRLMYASPGAREIARFFR